MMTREEREEEVSKRVGQLYKMDPDVTMRFGDKDRTLRFDNRAVLDVLKDTGTNVLMGISAKDLINPDMLGSLFHRGLQRNWTEVTRSLVDETINLRHLLYYQAKLMEAFQLFVPDVSDLPHVDEKGDIVEDPPTAQTGNGSDTGRLDAR